MIIKTFIDTDYVIIPTKEVKKIVLKKAIRNHAGGSLYRMNASSADIYAFSYYTNKQNKKDWTGGWDWSNNLVDKNADYILELATGKFYQLLK